MRQSIHLIARETFEHHGRTLVPGESFSTSPIEAAALRYQRKATFAPTQKAPAVRRGRYRRRDMVAED
jgi:hypothetical protein